MADQGTGQGDALFLAAGQDRRPGGFATGQADLHQRLGSLADLLVALEELVLLGGRAWRHLEAFEAGIGAQDPAQRSVRRTAVPPWLPSAPCPQSRGHGS